MARPLLDVVGRATRAALTPPALVRGRTATLAQQWRTERDEQHHPIADLFPMLAEDELRELAAACAR